MRLAIVLTYSLEERSLYNRENNTSVRGSWLRELAKVLIPYGIDNHIKLIGLDEKKRIEIEVSLPLFLRLKSDPMFIQKAENLRRVRTIKKSNSQSLIESIVFPISEFDNDLDDENVQKDYEDKVRQTNKIIHV